MTKTTFDHFRGNSQITLVYPDGFRQKVPLHGYADLRPGFDARDVRIEEVEDCSEPPYRVDVSWHELIT